MTLSHLQSAKEHEYTSSPSAAVPSSSSSIEITTHTHLSLLYRVIRLFLRPIRPRLVQAPKKPFPCGSPRLTPPKKRNVEIVESKCEGVWMYTLHVKHGPVVEGWAKAEGQKEGGETGTTLTSRGRKSSRRKNGRKHRVYYFNGGGFQSPPSGEHWRLLAQLAHDLAGSRSSVTFPGTTREKDPRRDAEIELVLVSYPLAPSSPARESLAILRKWFAAILDECRECGDRVSLMGDSSGANIALSLGFWAVEEYAATGSRPEQDAGEEKEKGTNPKGLEHGQESRGAKESEPEPEPEITNPLPSTTTKPTTTQQNEGTSSPFLPLVSLVCISPVVDMRNTNPEIKEADKFDPILTIGLTSRVAEIWTGNVNPSTSSKQDRSSSSSPSQAQSKPVPLSSPSVSPVLHDDAAFHALRTAGVRVHGIVGTHDVLAPDALVFMRRCDTLGVQGRWLVWEGQMHCFPLSGGGERLGVREGRVGRGYVEGLLRGDARWE